MIPAMVPIIVNLLKKLSTHKDIPEIDITKIFVDEVKRKVDKLFKNFNNGFTKVKGF